MHVKIFAITYKNYGTRVSQESNECNARMQEETLFVARTVARHVSALAAYHVPAHVLGCAHAWQFVSTDVESNMCTCI